MISPTSSGVRTILSTKAAASFFHHRLMRRNDRLDGLVCLVEPEPHRRFGTGPHGELRLELLGVVQVRPGQPRRPDAIGCLCHGGESRCLGEVAMRGPSSTGRPRRK